MKRIQRSLPSAFDVAKVGFRLFGLPRNGFGSIDVTQKCNLRCRHCYFFENDQPERALSVEEWVALLEGWKRTRSRWEFPFFQYMMGAKADCSRCGCIVPFYLHSLTHRPPSPRR